MPHKIENAYDAWWFLYNHPKFCLPVRVEVRDAEHAKTFLGKEKFLGRKIFWTIKKDKGGNLWAYSRSYNHAVQSNLDIHYTKTDSPGGHGTVSKDKSENKHIECWLEFGPERYGYSEEWQWKEDKQREQVLNYHDVDLDTGGTTFDEALINLARNVLKKYGDYKRGRD